MVVLLLVNQKISRTYDKKNKKMYLEIINNDLKKINK